MGINRARSGTQQQDQNLNFRRRGKKLFGESHPVLASDIDHLHCSNAFTSGPLPSSPSSFTWEKHIVLPSNIKLHQFTSGVHQLQDKGRETCETFSKSSMKLAKNNEDGKKEEVKEEVKFISTHNNNNSTAKEASADLPMISHTNINKNTNSKAPHDEVSVPLCAIPPPLPPPSGHSLLRFPFQRVEQLQLKHEVYAAKNESSWTARVLQLAKEEALEREAYFAREKRKKENMKEYLDGDVKLRQAAKSRSASARFQEEKKSCHIQNSLLSLDREADTQDRLHRQAMFRAENLALMGIPKRVL